MTERTTPSPERPMAQPSKPLLGEVVRIEGTQIRVRLVSGTVGFVDASANSQLLSDLAVGGTGRFTIHQCSADGETELRFVSAEEEDAPRSFESDVFRLQTALNHRHNAPAAHEAVVPALDEQRIQQWLQRAEQRLEQLRRNRAKRLDEEFYSRS